MDYIIYQINNDIELKLKENSCYNNPELTEILRDYDIRGVQ